MRLTRTLIAALATGLIATVAAAFPDKPVSLIVPFNAGGESDVAARFQQPFFKAKTGQDLILQYQPGAGGAQAWAALNSLPNDGYTLMGANLPHIIMQPMLQQPGYATDDIVLVNMHHFTPHALIVRADSPYRTLAELIEAAKAQPGAITVSGTGTNSANHVANQEFENATGAKLTYIPYSGTATASAALLGGEVEVQMGYPTVAVQQGDAVRMLAIMMDARHAMFPDVPTFKELGFDLVSGAFRGTAVPASTPESVRQQVSDVLEAVNSEPEHIRMMDEAGMAVLNIPYRDLPAWMAERKAVYERVARQLGAI